MPTFYQPESQEDWLDFRRSHLTATELASLHLRKTAANWQQVRHRKETGSQVHVTPLMQWGHGREPALAEALHNIDSRLIYNADPQRITVYDDDQRLCATPDMYSEDGVIGGEIKTTSREFVEIPQQYVIQCQLNMHYLGSQEWIILWEQHDGLDDDGVAIGVKEIQHKMLLPNRQLIEECLETAAEWFAWLDGTTPDWMTELDSLDDIDELAELVAEYADYDRSIAFFTESKRRAREKILEITGGNFKHELAGYQVSINTGHDTSILDSRQIKRKDPALFDELMDTYSKTRKAATTILITRKDQ